MYVLQQFKRAELHSIVVTVVVVSLVGEDAHACVCVAIRKFKPVHSVPVETLSWKPPRQALDTC